MKKFEKTAYGYIKDMFVQHHMIKRTTISIISILIMGLGIALFSVSGFGVDPFTSMTMNISSAVRMSFGTFQMLVNFALLFYIVVVAHRGLVGVGTVFNMIGVGYTCEFFTNIFNPIIRQYNQYFPIRLGVLAVGIVVLCFSCSLFFTANVGVGAYDAIGFMLARGAKIPYKWVRVITDVAVILIGLIVSGGLVAAFKGNFSEIKNIGIGTVITAFCMGPLVNFFNKTVSSKILNVDYEKLGQNIAFFMVKGAMVKNGPVRIKRVKNGSKSQSSVIIYQ